MANKNDVTVIIEIQRPTPKLGFGKPLILGSSAAGHAYKTYLDLPAVLVDYAASTEEYKAAFALFNQGDDSPREIAIAARRTGGTPETLEDILPGLFTKDWYFLVTTSTNVDDITTIGEAVEQDDTRQFFFRTSSKTDLAAVFAEGFTRTTGFYHTDVSNYPEAAWIGRTGSADVGSVTWKAKTLTGIQPLDIDATELAAIHALGANTYVTKAGDNVTSEGKTTNGEYIDVIHSKDYVDFNIEYAVQKLINSTDKIPYDDTGIAQIESVVLTVLQRAFNQGMIARDADGIGLYGTDFKSRAEVDPADRADRIYNDGEFWFELAGAIHEARIRGYIRL
ncbi:DUF3383 family protein [Paenibacillus caseinilyticus]|uniref:DUF3383 family protein n=1 Tax=Paenibacillus caseinilyticus TaxID=3098138 RepID=UPI0022B9246C|nr:DUF3383 family protein [Paenibacillus caseinilyticus]MCZ8518884.1 DUF3383 family protein [Paenibacillus caseinilyticus]